MGNVCKPLKSAVAFSQNTVENPNGQTIQMLVDPNGYEDCPTALAAFQQKGCVDSTVVLVCLVETGMPPAKLELCPGTQIWSGPGDTEDEAEYIDLGGIREISCQDTTCAILRSDPDPIGAPFDPCPFFVNDFGDDMLKITNVSFFAFDDIFDFDQTPEFAGPFFQGTFDPTDPASLMQFALTDFPSFLVCREANLSNEGLIENIIVSQGVLGDIPTGKKGGKGDMSFAGKKGHRLLEEEPFAAMAGHHDDTRIAEYSRKMQETARESSLDSMIVAVWECMISRMALEEGVDASSVPMTQSEFMNNKDCIRSVVRGK